jgi:hypothetical protein
VFLPLCGKTLDIQWLLSRGYGVAGSELSKIAVEQLFSELGVEPNITVTYQPAMVECHCDLTIARTARGSRC